MELNYNHKYRENIIVAIKHFLYTASLTILSLQIPLSFLLFSTSNNSSTATNPDTLFQQLLLPVIYAVVGFTDILGLANWLMGYTYKPSVNNACILVCIFQLCVELRYHETKFSIFSSVGCANANGPYIWMKRAILYFGFYKAVRVWTRMILKAVVDEAIFGEEVKESLQSNVIICVTFTALWILGLQREMELMFLRVLQKGLRHQTEFQGYALWLICIAVIMTGILTLLRGLLRIGELMFFRSGKDDEDECYVYFSSETDKV